MSRQPSISFAVIGHVDSGKSTFSGHLMLKLGRISDREMDKLKELAAGNDKQSFGYAYCMDTSKTERSTGKTIVSTTLTFNLNDRSFIIIDAPGHHSFIKNMISGTQQAEMCMLVVPAPQDNFNVAIGPQGSVKEHLTIMKVGGCRQICCLINKIDLVDYSEDIFNSHKKDLLDLITSLRFKDPTVAFIPISAYHGDNIAEKSEKMPWFTGFSYKGTTSGTDITGHTVKDYLITMENQDKLLTKPLRMILNQKYVIKGIGEVYCAKVLTGTTKAGDSIIVCPAGFKSDIKSIQINREAIAEALPGDLIGVTLKEKTQSTLEKGSVAGPQGADAPVTSSAFIANVAIDCSGLSIGATPYLVMGAVQRSVRVTKILGTLDNKGKLRTENIPQVLKQKMVARIIFHPMKPIVIEKQTAYPSLSRFLLRENGRVIASGACVTHLTDAENKEAEAEFVKQAAAVNKGERKRARKEAATS